MDLKALKEKEANAKNEMRSLLDKIKTEKRAISSEEATKLENFKTEISETRGAINAFTEIQENSKKQENNNNGDEVRAMKKGKILDFEARAAEKMIRGDLGAKEVRDFYKEAQENSEYRALSDNAGLTYGNTTAGTAGNGGVTVPLNVASQIIDKLDEVSPVFQMASKLTVSAGSMRIPRTDENSFAGWVGELDDVGAIKPQIDYVDLTQKRVGAQMQLTQEIINDSAVDIVSYAIDQLGKAYAKAVEQAILVPGATPAKSFHAILGTDSGITNIVSLVDPTAPTVEELIEITNTVNPGYLDGAAWVVSRTMYNYISTLKDGDGTLLLFKNIVPGAVTHQPEFLGFPVYVSDSLKGQDQQIIFGNLSAGYTIVTKSALQLVHVTNDSIQAVGGGHLIVLNGWMDGAVTQPDAFVLTKKA